MGKTPGKWIKTLLLGKKSPKSNLANGSENLRSAKNKKEEEPVVSGTDQFSNLSVDPSVVSSVPDAATTAQNVVSPKNDAELELEHAAIKVQAAFRGHQARRAFRTLKGIIRLQAVIRGHLVRRQAVATYSCIFGIVKFQALVRGQKARSSDNGIQCQKTHKDVAGDDSEALQLSTYSWMNNPTKFVFVDRLLASSTAKLPLKIQYGPEEPNSATVWLERWTQLQVWSTGSRAAKILVPKSKTKKRNYQEVAETEKARPKRGVKKQPGRNIGNGSNRSTTISEKPKRNVRKTSTLSYNPTRTESDKIKDNLRTSRSASKEGSPLEVKDEKPKTKLKRSSLSNGSKKTTRRSAEKEKDTAASVKVEPEVKVAADVLQGGDTVEKKEDIVDSVRIEPEVKVADVLEGEFKIESAEKNKDTADSVKIEPEAKVADVLEGDIKIESAEKKKDTADSVKIEPEAKVADVLEEEFNVESAEKKKDTADLVLTEPEVKVADVLEEGNTVEPAEMEKDTTSVVPKVLDIETEEISPEEDKPRAVETNGKGEDLKCSDVKESSENGNIVSDNTKASERRVSLSTNVDHQDDGHKHSGRKTPSYMAPTASAKARVKGESSPRFVQEKAEPLRRLSLSSPANGKLTTTATMSPRAQKLLIASAKGSMNGVKSFTSSKDISDKPTRTEWKR